MYLLQTPPKSRFRWILAGSAAAHVGVIALLALSYVWGVGLKFGSISFEDTGEESHYKVAMIDRTRPLVLPAGFFAVLIPPEKTPEPKPKAKPTDEDKKASKDDKKDDARKDDSPKPDANKPPADPNKFGKINTRSLKPHIQQIFTAYEQGRLSVQTFVVSVTCRALPDGSLTDIQLARSSGDPLIDETAMNLFRELSEMHALAPLSTLSSLTMSFEKTPTDASLSAVGFADDPSVSKSFADQLWIVRTAARFKMQNDDQKRLLENTEISASGNRVSVRLSLSNIAAGDMMRRSFGSQQAKST